MDNSLIINVGALNYAFMCGFITSMGSIMYIDIIDMPWKERLKLCTGAGFVCMGSYMSLILLSTFFKK